MKGKRVLIIGTNKTGIIVASAKQLGYESDSFKDKFFLVDLGTLFFPRRWYKVYALAEIEE